jgi:uncharacterized membrane protein HdeD (DUF308 family)
MAIEVKEREVARAVEQGIAQPVRRRVFGSGIVMVVLGILSILAPFVAGLVVQTVLAAVLIAAGLTWIVFAYKGPGERSKLGSWVAGLLSIACGVYMLYSPVAGLAALTFAMAAYFFGTGLARIFMSFELRSFKGWGLGLLNGFVTIALGVLIVAQWPLSGFWAVGILLGVDLIMAGFGLAGLGSTQPQGITPKVG